MQRHLIAGLALAACTASLDAQTITQTMPKGYETTDGTTGYHYRGFARYPAGRLQCIYGDWRGTQLLIKGFKLRRSNNNSSTNYGRSFSNVTIRMATSNMQQITDRWAPNMITTSQVFSASLTLPYFTGAPPSKPATWGKFITTDDVDFPFTSLWVSDKNLDTAVDFQFSGGVLANNAAWATNAAQSYRTDGAPANVAGGNTWAGGTTTAMGPGTCPVTGGGTTSPDLRTWLFSDNTYSGAKQHRWQWYGYDYPPNHPCFGVMSFFNLTTPIAMPGFDACEKLQLDLAKPWFLFPFLTDSLGDYVSDFYNWPFVTGSAGTKIYTQGALLVAGKNHLTQAFYASVPTPPATTKNFAALLYYYDKAKPYGYGPYDYAVPILGIY